MNHSPLQRSASPPTGGGRPWPTAEPSTVAQTAAPSPQEIHYVVQRAVQQGAWDRAVRLFRGALRLRCVPLTATYATVLEAALQGGGWRAASKLIDDLATSPLSATTLYHAAADILLLKGAINNPQAGREATFPDMVPFMRAAMNRGVLLAPRHRCVAWEVLLSAPEGAAIAASMGTELASLWAKGGCTTPCLDTSKELGLLMQAASVCGDAHLALLLLVVAVKEATVTGQVLTDALSAVGGAVARSEAEDDVPWEHVVTLVMQLLPAATTDPKESRAVVTAVEALREHVAAKAADLSVDAVNREAQYEALQSKLHALSPSPLPGVVHAVRDVVGGTREAWGVLRVNAAAVRARPGRAREVESRIVASSRVLCCVPTVLAGADLEVVFIKCFPCPWQRIDNSGAAEQSTVSLFERVVASVEETVADIADGVEEDGEGAEVLGLAAGLLFYLNHCAATAPPTESQERVERARLRVLGLVATGGVRRSHLSVSSDSVYAQAMLRAVLAHTAWVGRHDNEGGAEEQTLQRLLVDPSSEETEESQVAASLRLLRLCLEALQPSVTVLLLRPETALALVCRAADECDAVFLWVAALRYYRHLQRLGWATQESKDTLEAALRAAAGRGGPSSRGATPSTAVLAAYYYALQQLTWDSSLDPLRHTALPLLAAAEQWDKVDELLAVLQRSAAVLTAAEEQCRTRSIQNRLERAMCAAAVRCDGRGAWDLWQTCEDPAARWLRPAALESVCTVLLLTGCGMLWEADTLLAHHCTQCSGQTSPSRGDSPFFLPNRPQGLALWCYHHVRCGHVLVDAGSGALDAALETWKGQLGLNQLPVAQAEVALLWRCGASVAATLRNSNSGNSAADGGEGGTAVGYQLLLSALTTAQAEESRLHYYPPASAADTSPSGTWALHESDMMGRSPNVAVLLTVPWLPVMLPRVLLVAARHPASAAEENARVFAWCLRTLLLQLALTPEGDPTVVEAWADLLYELRYGPAVSGTLSKIAAEAALELLEAATAAGPTMVAALPLRVVVVATDNAFLRVGQWRWVAAVAESRAARGVETGTVLDALIAHTASSLAALGCVSEALSCVESTRELSVAPRFYSCEQSLREVPTAAARHALRADTVLTWALQVLGEHRQGRITAAAKVTDSAEEPLGVMWNAAAMVAYVQDANAWWEPYVLLMHTLEDITRAPTRTFNRRLSGSSGAATWTAPGGGVVDPVVVCTVMAAVAARGSWELALVGWHRILRALPHLDWTASHLNGAATDALKELVLSMERCGAEVEAALSVLTFQLAEVGAPVDPVAFHAVARMIVSSATAGLLTGAALQSCWAATQQLSQLRGEHRVAALVLTAFNGTHAAPLAGGESPWYRAGVPPSAVSTLDITFGRHQQSHGGRGCAAPLDEAQLNELASAAPFLVMATSKQLDELSRCVLGGAFKPFELQELLFTHAVEVKERLAQQTLCDGNANNDAANDPVVEYMARNKKLLATLTELRRQWSASSENVACSEEDQDTVFAEAMAQEAFSGFIGPLTARALWRRCRQEVLYLAACRWPPAAEAELRAGAVQGGGKVPPSLVTAPQLSRREIGHYWSTFHHVLVPELQFTPRELCLLAAYASQVEAAVTGQASPSPPKDAPVRRDWHATAFTELVAAIHAAHFSAQGAKGYNGAVGWYRAHPRWSIAAVFALSRKPLQRLWAQLEKDAEGRRLYVPLLPEEALPTSRSASSPAKKDSPTASPSRLALVAALAAAATSTATFDAPPGASQQLPDFLPELIAAAMADDPHATADELVERVHGIVARGRAGSTAVTESRLRRAVELESAQSQSPLQEDVEGTPTPGGLAAAMPSLPVRVLVRVVRSYAAARLPVPPAASLALLEEMKVLAELPTIGKGVRSLSLQECRLVLQARAEEQLWVWRALCDKSGQSLAALPFMDPTHVAAMRKLVCPTRESVRGLPVKKETGTAAAGEGTKKTARHQ